MNVPGSVMVTGGAGFIGSHLVEALLNSGVSVSVVDNLDDFYPAAYKRANLKEIAKVGKIRHYEADIRQAQSLKAIFQAERPEVVIHLAALAGVRPSIARPRLYEEVNVGGTLNLLELSRQFGVGRFIFGSSSSVYGADANAPFSEGASGLKPISPYAASKLAAELFCYTYAHLYRLSVVCLRFFTVYGPRQRPDLAIRKFAELMEAAKPVPIYGDGTSGRDYTYVDDTVRGILAAISYETDFDVFNLGGSHPVKLVDLIHLLEKATGMPARVEFHPCQPGDVPLTWANIEKARRLLGYEPRISLEAGLSKFCAWRLKAAEQQAAAANHCRVGVTRMRLPIRQVVGEEEPGSPAYQLGRP